MKGNGLPEGMIQVRSTVLLHRAVARDHFLIRCLAPKIAQRARPGQFIHVRCSDESSPLLRRPFSLMDVDPNAGTIDFIYKIVGFGTKVLSEIPARSTLDLLGPLGSCFKTRAGWENAYLLGGGVGIPPLVLLGKWLRLPEGAAPGASALWLRLPEGVAPGASALWLRAENRVKDRQVVAFLGARTRDWVICANDFKKLGIPVQVATDDGSWGREGSVVDLLEIFLKKIPHEASSTAIYICGPTPMMRAAAALALRYHLAAQVSLEERMGCAMGCCMGCVVEVNTEPTDSHARFQRVCTEGPVFEAEEIIWK